MTLSETTIHPLSNLNPRKTHRIKLENVSSGSNTTKTVATLTGAGVITNIWCTMNATDKDVRLQVLVDGEIEPSIDIDVASLFMCSFIGDSSTGIGWSTQNMHGEGGQTSSQGGYIRFPIPYSNGCIVRFKAVTALQLYCMVDYTPDLLVPYRLKSINYSITNSPISFASTDTKDLFTTPTGSAGWFVWFSYEANPASNDSYLERNFLLYLDGEGTSSHQSSGTEDFFFGSYYWQYKAGGFNNGLSNNVSAVSYRNTTTHKVAVAADLMALCNGYYFTNSCKLTVATEASVGTSHNAGFVALFYTPVTSTWAQPITNATAPGAPTNLVATAGNASATVTFTAPASDGGATITNYTITSSPGGITASGGSSPITVTGLTNGTAYTFTATATNSAGTSVASSPSNSVTPVASTVPGAPTIGTATAGNASATVTFTAPASDGGSAITGYTVTSSPGSITASGSSSPITVTGLTNGTAYTFTVHATNANGNSAESSASNSVTPAGVTTYVSDTFAGADTTTGLLSHTPDINTYSGTWTKVSRYGNTNNWGITGNKAYASAAPNEDCFCYIDGGNTDGTLECDITLSSTTDRTLRGLVFRASSVSSFLKLMLVKVSGVNQLELRKQDAAIAVASGAGLVDGTTYHVKIVLNGVNIKVYIDNVLKIDNSDAGNTSFTGTLVGLAVQANTTSQDDLQGTWDNFTFTA